MSTPINWQTLTPEQRDRIVAEKIFHWQPVPCDEELTIYDDGMAFCYGCKQRDHISAFEHDVIAHPAYTTSMDAAMSVLRTVVKLETCDHDVLSEELWDTVNGDIWPPTYATKMVCDWTPEKICLTALKSAGCEVQP